MLVSRFHSPCGHVLHAVRRHLRADKNEIRECALFWECACEAAFERGQARTRMLFLRVDRPSFFRIAARSYASMPQKPRTAPEGAGFGRALKVMGRLYASIAGTAVIQFTAMPQPPPEHEELLRVWNPRPYSERGWTTFEEGASMVVVAHLTAAEGQAADRDAQIPERFANAQRRRPKLVDISDEPSRPIEVTKRPEELLQQTIEKIANATFTGKVLAARCKRSGSQPVCAPF